MGNFPNGLHLAITKGLWHSTFVITFLKLDDLPFER
jgi:hypothetical protein